MSTTKARKQSKELLDKSDPHDDNAENAVLAIVLLHPGRFGEIAAALKPQDFRQENARITFEAMKAVFDSGRPPELTLLCGALQDAGQYDRDCGPNAFTLLQLYKLFPIASNLTFYLTRVLEMSRRREELTRGLQLIQSAHTGGKPFRMARIKREAS